ncbi:interleukin-17 receptor B isoform X3 [Gasterosteus aculeatus]
MMWAVGLILLYSLATQATSQEIQVECRECELPSFSDKAPSVLVDLKVAPVTDEEIQMNISWAINIDASIEYLTGTRIVIQGESTHVCEYKPALAEADLGGSKQKWFYYLVNAKKGSNSIQAANQPMHLGESSMPYKSVSIEIPGPKQRVTPKQQQITVATELKEAVPGNVDFIVSRELKETVPGNVDFTSITSAIFGGLAGLMTLSSCYILYLRYGANVATFVGFKKLPASPVAPVPVLVVYAAEDPAFQGAVVALVEFLQSYGGCSVAVDMWQQRKIAELGPMRWLAEKVKTAQRVLIVCPKSSLRSSRCPPNHTFPEPSIPASAPDLYPLILNMVAGHAKSSRDLAKFCVVQLSEEQDNRPRNLAPELRACRSFCLMKDLTKLCRSLHGKDQDAKISDLIFRPRIVYTEKCTGKLREAIKKIGGHEPNISREAEPLKSVVSII